MQQLNIFSRIEAIPLLHITKSNSLLLFLYILIACVGILLVPPLPSCFFSLNLFAFQFLRRAVAVHFFCFLAEQHFLEICFGRQSLCKGPRIYKFTDANTICSTFTMKVAIACLILALLQMRADASVTYRKGDGEYVFHRLQTKVF